MDTHPPLSRDNLLLLDQQLCFPLYAASNAVTRAYRPLLEPLGEENFGFHVEGGSSIGKTTLLRVAASVWGAPIQSWRTTDNAAEGLARAANDGLLILDELSQVDGTAADAMAYMLGNGVGDTYFEAGYGFSNVSLFVGAGNGQYTSDGGFNVCNVGIKATESIKLTENFSLPINGAVILNPSKQAFHIVVGISL